MSNVDLAARSGGSLTNQLGQLFEHLGLVVFELADVFRDGRNLALSIGLLSADRVHCHLDVVQPAANVFFHVFDNFLELRFHLADLTTPAAFAFA